MRRSAFFSLLLLMALASCGNKTVQTPETYDLSGQLKGEFATLTNLRLAMVGVGLPGLITNESTHEQTVVVDSAYTRRFGFDLPNWPDLAGVYQVIAFSDSNNNAKYDLGEKFARNRQWLIFSPTGGDLKAVTIPEGLPGAGEEAVPAMTVAKGWNLYDKAQPLSGGNPRPGTPITDYDISR